VVFGFKDDLVKIETQLAVLKKSMKFINEKFDSELDRRLVVEDFKRGMR
jgi:hypothetical protein